MENQSVSVRSMKCSLDKVKDNALLIGFIKEKTGLSGELKKFDAEHGNIVSSFIRDNSFKAEKGDVKSIYINKSLKNIVLVGLGEQDKFSISVMQNAVADACKKLRNGVESLSILLGSFSGGVLDEKELAEKASLGCLMGLYKFTEFKTKDKDKIKSIRQITLITDSGHNLEKETEYAAIVAEAVNKTRDFVNTPPNVATPEHIADYAKNIGKNFGIKAKIFDENGIAKMKMGCFLGVARGSVNKPRLVVLEYNGAAKSKKPIVIVGKGVTFDSGGLNVKPYPYILNMKDDKGGALAAIHTIEACAKLRMPVNLVVIAPFCENMIDAASYRPDDVLTAYNGMTVEIKNTDAEGRLILADALAYAAELKPEVIIDIATLTGASMVTLGYVATPFLATDEKLSEKIKSASKKSLEKVWELPLWPEFEESIKSDVADIKNISEEGDAGVIIGATFLKNFVGEVPWAHIDIGTTVWSKVDKGILTKGGTGATVRLMMELLREWK
ncbi:leucyl aminopeptidase [Candidatus Woesearchaeota archaeon]|nr:leucyl aminopeptidase [Candidatus Woesearchaeota archaeon]